MPARSFEELVHANHRIELERLALGRDRDRARAARSLLGAVAATGAQLVARYNDGTIAVRLPGTAGPEAAPVVRLAEPAGREKPLPRGQEEPLALAALQASKDLAGKTATGSVYTVLPGKITGLSPAGAGDEIAHALVAEAFGKFWRDALPLRSPGTPPATAVMDPGVDPRTLQAVVDGLGALGAKENPPARLILTDVRRPTPSFRGQREIQPEELPVRLGEPFPSFTAPPSTDAHPTIVVALSSVREGELREVLPGYRHESSWPQGAPIVLPPSLNVVCVPSKGDALANALGRPEPSPPQPGGRVVEAAERFQPGARRRGRGPAGPSAT